MPLHFEASDYQADTKSDKVHKTTTEKPPNGVAGKHREIIDTCHEQRSAEQQSRPF
ncbi:MAG: hypothetical protein ACYS0I_05305 [Planctomycetota bacterium]